SAASARGRLGFGRGASMPDADREAQRTRLARVMAGVRADRTAAGVVLVVLALLGTLAVVWHGAGPLLPRISDIGAWLADRPHGRVVHANGLAGRTDAQVTLRGADGHPLVVIQDGNTVLVQDTVTGAVSRIDPAQLAVTASVTFTTAGAQ